MANLFDNLVFRLKMNDNAASTVVLNAKGPPHGTSVRNTSLMHVPGVIGGALDFNGVSDDVNCNQTFQSTFRATDSNGFTIAGRWKPNDGQPDNSQYLFDCYTADVTTHHYLLIQSGGQLEYYFEKNLTGDELEIDTPVVFTHGQQDWHNIVIVMEQLTPTSVQARIYVDSILVDSETAPFGLSGYTTTGNMFIGRIATAGTNRFSGSLDDFMIFNKPLTADEVIALSKFAGCLTIYRGQDGIIDYDNIVAAMDIDDEEISIVEQDLPPDTIWHYIRRQVSDCGLESPDSPPCIVVIDSDGEMIGSTPNRPVNIIIEQLAGGKLRLRWRYFATNQEIKATGFNIYIDDGGGFDFDEPLIAVPYRGAVENEWTSNALTHGQRYKFVIRSYAQDAGESNNTQYVSAVADSQGPAAATGLILAWQEV